MKLQSQTDLYRKLPSVDELAHSPKLEPLVSREGQVVVVDAVRAVRIMREAFAAGRLDANGLDLALRT